MKTTHAVEKTARVRQEFHPSDFESVQSKMDNFWGISGVLQSKNRNEFNSKRTKNYRKQSIGCGLQVSHWDGYSNLQ